MNTYRAEFTLTVAVPQSGSVCVSLIGELCSFLSYRLFIQDRDSWCPAGRQEAVGDDGEVFVKREVVQSGLGGVEN